MALIKLNSRAIPDDTVVEADIADGSVTSAKITYPLTTFSSTGIDDNATSTSMTLTSSNDVAFGNTSANLVSNTSTQGGGGYVASDKHFEFATNSNRAAVEIGKNNANDGQLVALRKQGTTVGSIGTNGTRFYLTGSGRGLAVDESAFSVLPVNTTGANNDGGVGLGSSAARFSNLYLSGGAYIGGTGSANYLDDYEEGSFTPILTGEGSCTITTSTALGQYNKVGRIVNVSIFFQVSSVSGGSSALAVQVDGLPFTTNTNLNTTGAIRAQNMTNSASSLWLNIFNNATGGRIEEWNGANAGNLSDHITSTTNFAMSITYSIT